MVGKGTAGERAPGRPGTGISSFSSAAFKPFTPASEPNVASDKAPSTTAFTVCLHLATSFSEPLTVTRALSWSGVRCSMKHSALEYDLMAFNTAPPLPTTKPTLDCGISN
eukprot:Skav217518  [mRNA]  locus=scaffold647:177079:179503:+ [translate_table: standard]